MTHTEFIKWINTVEKRFPVVGWRINGLHVWPLIRLTLYSVNFETRVKEFSLSGNLGNKLHTIIESMFFGLRAYIIDWRNNVHHSQKADVLFLAYSVGSQPTIEKVKYNPLVVPYIDILKELQRSTLVWEMVPYADYNIPRATPSHFIQPYLIVQRISSQFSKIKTPDTEMDQYQEFLQLVERSGLEYRYSSYDRLLRDVLFIRRLANGFKKRLLRIRPEIVFIADAGPREQAICLACRELGIVSVELQHGIQGPLHPSYGSWASVPTDGYETRPQIYWCWDKESTAAINDWAQQCPQAHFAVEGGDPWRQIWTDDGNEIALKVDQQIRRAMKATSADTHILVTLTSIDEVIPDIISEVILHSPPNWHFWLRLHPVNQHKQRKHALEQLKIRGIETDSLDLATRVPLFAILKHMHCHLTASYSTVIAQAADMGVHSVTCNQKAESLYPDQLERGALTIARSRDDILSAIDKHRAKQTDHIKPSQINSQLIMLKILELGTHHSNGGA